MFITHTLKCSTTYIGGGFHPSSDLEKLRGGLFEKYGFFGIFHIKVVFVDVFEHFSKNFPKKPVFET